MPSTPDEREQKVPQTAEDLEDLAAQSIAPSAEKLEAVRRKYGYPQAWYDDDGKPW
jgi:hypothetical protein